MSRVPPGSPVLLDPSLSLLLANGVLLIHAGIAAFVVGESWLGLVCPLTTLEMSLRSGAGESSYGGGFIEHWLQQLLYYSAPPWLFVVVYTAFAVLVLATWYYFPPRFKRRAVAPVA